MPEVISLENVRKEYPGTVAVEGVSLEIERGEFFTLLGPSGSGKTTILRTIAGLETLTSGAVILDGEDVTDRAAYDRDVNTVFQNYALFPHMTVAENVRYGLKIRGREREVIDDRVDELLALVDLPDYGNRDVASLSGGEQQRVALARSLAIEPKVLLLDEPLGALDEKLRREMQVELKEIQEQLETTFVYVTHDQEEALSMSDRIGVVNDGEIVQIGEPTEIYKRPRTAFVASFFHRSNVFTAEVTARDEETVALSFLGKTISATDPDGRAPPEGESVEIFIQPEQVALEGDHADTFEGTIENKIYRGSLVDYTVRVDDTEFLASRTVDTFEEGAAVTIGWGVGDTVVLEAED